MRFVTRSLFCSLREMSRKRKADEAEIASPKSKEKKLWSHSLRASMEDPSLRVDEDDLCIIIKDKYPKARHHFLVLPKEDILNLNALKPEHLSLLRHMHDKGKSLSDSLNHPWTFKLGYHAIPSMSQIHLHVISTDFDSIGLRNKKHWNSFTTEYFVDSEEVMRLLESEGMVELDKSKFDALLKSQLKCHLCTQYFTTMPALKKHVSEHEPS